MEEKDPTQGIKVGDKLHIVSGLYPEGVERTATKHYGNCTYYFADKWWVWTYSGETYQQFEIGTQANKIDKV